MNSISTTDCAGIVLGVLDMLAAELAGHEHVFTPEQRRAYESAVRLCIVWGGPNVQPVKVPVSARVTEEPTPCP